MGFVILCVLRRRSSENVHYGRGKSHEKKYFAILCFLFFFNINTIKTLRMWCTVAKGKCPQAWEPMGQGEGHLPPPPKKSEYSCRQAKILAFLWWVPINATVMPIVLFVYMYIIYPLDTATITDFLYLETHIQQNKIQINWLVRIHI